MQFEKALQQIKNLGVNPPRIVTLKSAIHKYLHNTEKSFLG